MRLGLDVRVDMLPSEDRAMERIVTCRGDKGEVKGERERGREGDRERGREGERKCAAETKTLLPVFPSTKSNQHGNPPPLPVSCEHRYVHCAIIALQCKRQQDQQKETSSWMKIPDVTRTNATIGPCGRTSEASDALQDPSLQPLPPTPVTLSLATLPPYPLMFSVLDDKLFIPPPLSLSRRVFHPPSIHPQCQARNNKSRDQRSNGG